MRPSQQLPNFAPLPAPCDSSHSLLPSEEPFDVASILNAMEPEVEEEALFHCDDIIMQTNAITTICSSLEEQWMMTDCMCTDNYLHDCAFTHASNVNFEDGCSLDLWAEFMEMPIQTHNNASSASAISPACFPNKTFLSDMDTPFIQPSQVFSEVSSFSAHQDDSHAPYINNHHNEHLNITPFSRCNSTNSICASFSPSFLSHDTSGAHLTNADCSFLHPSPVFSEASSSFAAANQHDPVYMSDHTNDHLNMHMSIHCNETSSVHTPILPDLVHSNVAMTYSGSTRSNIATSDNDFFNNEASSFVAFTGPPPQLNLSIAGAKHALNLEERASQPWLNLEAGASPLQEESRYSMNTAGAVRNHDDGEPKPTEDVVRFLVESSTLAIDDGFTWRKYGQKIIKGKAHPRCYFRCAQPDCSVKKQIECSSEAQGYVLIAYFGRHNH